MRFIGLLLFVILFCACKFESMAWRIPCSSESQARLNDRYRLEMEDLRLSGECDAYVHLMECPEYRRMWTRANWARMELNNCPQSTGSEDIAVNVAKNASVLLLGTNNKYTVCGGVHISKNQIVTAYHCLKNVVDDDSGLQVRYVDYSDWIDSRFEIKHATVIDAHAKQDIAILSTLLPTENWVMVENANVNLSVFAVHHGSFEPYTLMNAKVSSISLNDAIVINKPVTNGASGSGLFNENGQLVGICRGVEDNSGNAVYTRALYIQNLM